MFAAYESESRKKAMIYTTIICAIMILFFVIVKWKWSPGIKAELNDNIEIVMENDPTSPEIEQQFNNGNSESTKSDASGGEKGDLSKSGSGGNISTGNSNDNTNVPKNPKAVMGAINTGVGDGDPDGGFGSDNGNNTNPGGGIHSGGNGGKDVKIKLNGDVQRNTKVEVKIKISPSGTGTFYEYKEGTNKDMGLKKLIIDKISKMKFEYNPSEPIELWIFNFETEH